MAGNIDPFLRALLPRLQEDVATRMATLASGSASHHDGDAASTAEKYAAAVAYISAMNAVMELCLDIENQMYGGEKPAEEQG